MEKDNVNMYDIRKNGISHAESKTDSNELIYKTETDSDLENKLMVTKGERMGRGIN